MSDTDTAEAIKELLEAWTKVEAAAKRLLPGATEEDLSQAAKSAMSRALKL